MSRSARVRTSFLFFGFMNVPIQLLLSELIFDMLLSVIKHTDEIRTMINM